MSFLNPVRVFHGVYLRKIIEQVNANAVAA
jgi:hypothetical protein